MTAERAQRFHHRRSVQLAAGLAVTAACLAWSVWIMVRGRDPGTVWDQIQQAFAQARYWTLAPIWALLFLFYWLKALRWRVLLTPLGDYRPLRDLFPPIMIGFAFNNVLPAHLGEFVRVFVFSRQKSLAKTAVLASVALERILDGVAILLLMGVGLMFVSGPGLDDSIRRTASIAAAAAGLSVLMVAVYLTFTRPFVRIVEWCLELMPLIPEVLRAKAAGLLESGAEGLAAIRNWKRLASVSVNSLVQWSVNVLVIWISLWSFDIEVSPLVAAILMGVVAFGVTVPSSPGYFGVIQALFLVVLQLFTQDEAGVFAASIYYHLSQYVPVTILGLWYFSRSGLRVEEVEDEAEHEREELIVTGERGLHGGVLPRERN